MAKKTPPPRAHDAETDNPAASAAFLELLRRAETTGTTGRFIVLMRPGATSRATKALEDQAGVATVSTADSDHGTLTASEIGSKGLVLAKLGLAIATLDSDQAQAVASASDDSGIQEVFPERLVYATTSASFVRGQYVAGGDDAGVNGGQSPAWAVPARPALSADYLLGYREAVVRFVDGILGGATGPGSPLGQASAARGGQDFRDDHELTWGLRAIEVERSPLTGAGVRVAVLDTGIDVNHPDFLGRVSGTKSFIPGQSVQDGHGHGTHCAGTVCGPRRPQQGPRYGVAPDADLFVGKVLANGGSSIDGSVLQGIEWAINQGCRVVSMSLSQQTNGQPSQFYEEAGERAKEAGTALIAAAGNDSDRRVGMLRRVGAPANSSFIMAVGGIDRSLQMYIRSNTSTSGMAGKIDIVGPGVDVYSSWSRTASGAPGLYNVISGTSMATPHVAGVAALIAEAKPNFSAGDVLNALMMMATRLELPSADVGAGLVRAPR